MRLFKKNQSADYNEMPSKSRRILELLLAIGVPGIVVSIVLWIIPSPSSKLASNTANNVAKVYQKIQSDIIGDTTITLQTNKAREIQNSQLELQASLKVMKSYTE